MSTVHVHHTKLQINWPSDHCSHLEIFSFVAVNSRTIIGIAVISQVIVAILEILLISCAFDIVHSKGASRNGPIITSSVSVAMIKSKLSKVKGNQFHFI